MSLTVALIVLLITVLGSGMGVVYTKHQSRELVNELQAVRKHKEALELEWMLLQLEQSTLDTQAVVDPIARERLGMIVPRPDVVVYITP